MDTNYVISFYKNGKYQGACYEIPVNRRDKGWFPVISLRNVSAEFNFGSLETEFCPIEVEVKEEILEKVEEEKPEGEKADEVKELPV
jgi:hypothetical protein